MSSSNTSMTASFDSRIPSVVRMVEGNSCPCGHEGTCHFQNSQVPVTVEVVRGEVKVICEFAESPKRGIVRSKKHNCQCPNFPSSNPSPSVPRLTCGYSLSSVD